MKHVQLEFQYSNIYHHKIIVALSIALIHLYLQVVRKVVCFSIGILAIQWFLFFNNSPASSLWVKIILIRQADDFYLKVYKKLCWIVRYGFNEKLIKGSGSEKRMKPLSKNHIVSHINQFLYANLTFLPWVNIHKPNNPFCNLDQWIPPIHLNSRNNLANFSFE